MRIIGIDPGTLNVGYGIIEMQGNALRFITGGCIKASGSDIAQRLVQIHQGLTEVIAEFKPAEAAVETVFAGNNARTAIAIGEGRGVALLSVAQFGLPVVGYEPTVVKKAVTSSGRAGKEQMRQMVKILLCLPALPETDHEADALAMAIAHSRRREVEKLSNGKIVSSRNSRGMCSGGRRVARHG